MFDLSRLTPFRQDLARANARACGQPVFIRIDRSPPHGFCIGLSPWWMFNRHYEPVACALPNGEIVDPKEVIQQFHVKRNLLGKWWRD
jgi:hypothetical protein